MISACKTECRKRIIISGKQELQYRIIAVNPAIQGLDDRFSQLPNWVFVQQK